MPSNWLYVDTQFPQFTDESPNEKITIIQNYMFMLVEQMRYTLNNLDTSNMNTTALNQFVADITEPINVRIAEGEEKMTSIQVGVDGISTRVQTVETGLGTVNTKYSSLEQTVNGFSTRVASVETGLGTVNTKYSTLEQTVNGFKLEVANGTTSSTIKLMAGATEISSQIIKFTGDVVFASNLTDGETIISGSNIMTGQIDADFIHLGGEMLIYEGPEPTVDSYAGSFGAYSGWATDTDGTLYQTYGVGIRYSETRGQLMCTNAGVWCGYGSRSGMSAYSAGVTITGSTITMDGTVEDSSGTVISSDARLKRDIDYDVRKLMDILLQVHICTYRRSGGTRRHAGVIAQELEQVRDSVGVSSEDYAALCINEKGFYGVRYLQWVPVNTALLQDHEARLRALEGRT